MQISKVKLLIVDDDAQALRVAVAALESAEVEIIQSTDPEECMPLIRRHQPHIVLLDVVMPRLSGMDLLHQIVAQHQGIDVVLFTGNYSSQAALKAIQEGASDYIEKPVKLQVLRERISRLVQESKKYALSLDLERELIKSKQFHGMVGQSPVMQDLFRKITRIAPHYQTVLLSGPTGSGKELVARALRDLSPVSTGPFRVINCAAIVETLFESELFGHVKGSFTGANSDRVGLFESANRGTVFLDEVEELTPSGQAKLLRVLQEGEIQRVGDGGSRSVDVRVIAASNRDLRTLVEEKKFREDLFYRLAMIEIRVPALVERKPDIEPLSLHFLDMYTAKFKKHVTGISSTCYEVFDRYSWPGNVRELENAIGNAVIMTDSNVIQTDHLPIELSAHLRTIKSFNAGNFEASCDLTMEQLETRYINAILEIEAGDVSGAARRLGIPRSTLYQRLRSQRRMASNS